MMQNMNPLMCRPEPNPHFAIMHYLSSRTPRREVHDEEDLASVALQIQRKRFYVDVKKNRRGIFMKIAEVGTDGRKARILLTLYAAAEIKDKLKDLIDVLDESLKQDENVAPPDSNSENNDKSTLKNPDLQNGDGLIKSHVVNCSYRRYFLDLKKNRRGYFLRLTMLSTLNRIQLAVPSQGMLDLYNAMNDLLIKWWDGSKTAEQTAPDLPESKSLRVDNRTLYFDSSFNRFGPFLRISEVRSSSRTAITIPNRALSRFRDIVNGLADDLINIKVSKDSEDDQQTPDASEIIEESTPQPNGDIS